ncbi:MAG: hypothetical protein UC390_05140, partial [Peptococcaceae bacterium]|nr:hypothetical protein [Peptococcaceae bacterium]
MRAADNDQRQSCRKNVIGSISDISAIKILPNFMINASGADARDCKLTSRLHVVPPIIWTSELLGVFLLSKLTHQQKLEIYAKRKAGYTISH